MDHIMFFGAAGASIFILATLLTVPNMGLEGRLGIVPLALLPWTFYFAKRSSPYGGGLIDFLEQLLEAQSLKHRAGDPIART